MARQQRNIRNATGLCAMRRSRRAGVDRSRVAAPRETQLQRTALGSAPRRGGRVRKGVVVRPAARRKAPRRFQTHRSRAVARNPDPRRTADRRGDDESGVPEAQPRAGRARSACSKPNSGAAICSFRTTYSRRSIRNGFRSTSATRRGLERWRRHAQQKNPQLLFMSREDVLQQTVRVPVEDGLSVVCRASRRRVQVALQLRARRDRRRRVAAGAARTARARASGTARLARAGHARRAKCEALIRSLPKALRRPLAPVPEKIDTDHAGDCCARTCIAMVALERVLGERLAGFFDVKIPLDAWRLDAIDPHLKMNVQVRDNKGDLVDQDRDVAALLESSRSACGAANRRPARA